MKLVEFTCFVKICCLLWCGAMFCGR